jgi:hypothetical protein
MYILSFSPLLVPDYRAPARECQTAPSHPLSVTTHERPHRINPHDEYGMRGMVTSVESDGDHLLFVLSQNQTRASHLPQGDHPIASASTGGGSAGSAVPTS